MLRQVLFTGLLIGFRTELPITGVELFTDIETPADVVMLPLLS